MSRQQPIAFGTTCRARRRISRMAVQALLAAIGSAAADGPPRISDTSLTAEGPILVFGANFDAPDLAVHVQTLADPNGPSEGELRQSLRRCTEGTARLPAPPPADDKGWQKAEHHEDSVLLCDAGGHASHRPAAVKVLYVRTSMGVSQPQIMNRPEIWGVSPRGAEPGAHLTVWGVNLGRKFALVSSSGQIAILKSYLVYNPHSHRPEAKFVRGTVVPQELTPGALQLHAWAGGGDAGWSEGFEVEVVEPAQKPANVLNMSDFGAVGDGVSDDTQAFHKALAAAEQLGGARVNVPPGRYVIWQTLELSEGTALCGVSRDVCVILADPSRPIDNARRPKQRRYHPSTDRPIVRLSPNCTLSDLTIDVTRAPVPERLTIMLHVPGGWPSSTTTRASTGPTPTIASGRASS